MDTQITVDEKIIQTTIDRFWETFPPVWNRVRSVVRATVAEHFDISVEQFHILRNIRRGVESVSGLAEVKQISRPAISQAVDVLVDRGYISRHQDPADRRYVHLRLTLSGEDLLNQIFKTNRAWMAEKMAALSPAELQNIEHALEVLNKALCDSAD